MDELTQIEAPVSEFRARTAHSANPMPGALVAYMTDHTPIARFHLGMRYDTREPDLLLSAGTRMTLAIVVAERKASRLAVLDNPRILVGKPGKKCAFPLVKDRALWFTFTSSQVKRLLPHCPLRWALVADCDGHTYILLKGEIYAYDTYPGVAARKLTLHFSPRVAGDSRGSTRDHRVRPGALPILNT